MFYKLKLRPSIIFIALILSIFPSLAIGHFVTYPRGNRIGKISFSRFLIGLGVENPTSKKYSFSDINFYIRQWRHRDRSILTKIRFTSESRRISPKNIPYFNLRHIDQKDIGILMENLQVVSQLSPQQKDIIWEKVYNFGLNAVIDEGFNGLKEAMEKIAPFLPFSSIRAEKNKTKLNIKPLGRIRENREVSFKERLSSFMKREEKSFTSGNGNSFLRAHFEQEKLCKTFLQFIYLITSDPDTLSAIKEDLVNADQKITLFVKELETSTSATTMNPIRASNTNASMKNHTKSYKPVGKIHYL